MLGGRLQGVMGNPGSRLSGMAGGGGGVGGGGSPLYVTLTFNVYRKSDKAALDGATATVFGPLGMRAVQQGPTLDKDGSKVFLHPFQVTKIRHPWSVNIPGVQAPIRGMSQGMQDETINIPVEMP